MLEENIPITATAFDWNSGPLCHYVACARVENSARSEVYPAGHYTVALPLPFRVVRSMPRCETCTCTHCIGKLVAKQMRDCIAKLRA